MITISLHTMYCFFFILYSLHYYLNSSDGIHNEINDNNKIDYKIIKVVIDIADDFFYFLIYRKLISRYENK